MQSLPALVLTNKKHFMRQVNTVEELISERKRLKLKKELLESEIHENIVEIKEILKPISLIKNGLKSITHTKDTSDLVSNSAGSLVEMLMRNVLFRNSGLITKWLVPKLFNNAASNAVHNNKSFFLEKLADLVLTIGKRKSKKHYDASTAYAEV